MSEESKRQIAKGIATAAIELAVIRSELCREDAPPLMPEECAEVVRDAWNAMQGIDTCSAEPCEELLAFYKLLEERGAAMRALESLTPGGSEYVGDVQRCVQTVRDTRSNLMEQLRKRVEERDALLAAAKPFLLLFDELTRNSPHVSYKWTADKMRAAIALVEGRKVGA